MEIDKLLTTLYNPKTFPAICKSEDRAPLTEDDLQIDDFYLGQLRSCGIRFEKYDVNKFTQTLSKIFMDEEMSELQKIRSVLMMFAFEKIINISQVYGFVVTENVLGKTQLYTDEDEQQIFLEEGKYFNKIFYKELGRHPILMVDVIETIEKFCSKNSSQYKNSYSIIKEIIETNEDSLTPIIPNKFDFMTQNLVGKYRNQIVQACPIILPFEMKLNDYLKWYEKVYFAKIKNNYTVKTKKNEVLKTVWSLSLLDSYDKNFYVDFIGEKEAGKGEIIEKVQRENFIKIAFEEIFGRKTDLFILRKDCYWFKPHTQFETKEEKDELLKKYFCIGVLLGIAVSYHIKMPYHFPPYFYKKLLHRNLTHADLKTYDSENYLKMINDLNNNRIKKYVYVDPMSHEEIDLVNFTLIDDDDYKVVDINDDNKCTYLDDVAKWIFDYSIKDEFEAFENGFRKLRRDPYFYRCFRLDELDRLVSGQYERNWDELKNNVKYVDCNKNSKHIVWFWNYFKELDEMGKINILKYIRGSSFVPPGGLKNVHITINKVDCDKKIKTYKFDEKIDIPEFDSYDKLKGICNYVFGIS